MSNFNQLCVWQGTTLGDSTPKDFEDYFKSLGFEIKFAEVVETLPDRDENGYIVKGTGGRSDILFYIHDDCIRQFSIPRLSMGIRWWEDVVSYNKQSYLYPQNILDKYPVTW